MESPRNTILVYLLFAFIFASGSVKTDIFVLRLLHTNDMHARFLQISRSAGKCSDYEAAYNLCYGGFSRLRTALVKEHHKAHKENISVLSLNAGDSFQGTVWYTVFKWKAVVHFLNMLKIDAMALGNHEFDDGIKGVIPFLNEISIPVLSSNLNFSLEPEMSKTPLKRNILLERGVKKIGILGYLTPQTQVLSNTGKLLFEDEIPTLIEEAKALKDAGVDIIIALGHSGYDVDLEIAKHVPHIDIVVGGHSHSFLYTGSPPDIEVPIDRYPVLINQSSGRTVVMVQAYCFTKYLGKVDITFDKNGEVISAVGNPILLDHTIEEDSEMLKELNKWHAQLNDSLIQTIGISNVLLDGSNCRFYECNLGNLITDAYVHHAVKTNKNNRGHTWTQAAIALQQGGGIRASIDATGSNGMVTREDVMTSMPFFSSLSVVRLKGRGLWTAFEWSVSRYDLDRKVGRGEFLQVSGAKVKFDLRRPGGERVVSLEVRCVNCSIPTFETVDFDEYYDVIMPTFLFNGGDKYTTFKENGREIHKIDVVDTEIVIQYIEDAGIIYPGVEGRIEFIQSENSLASFTSALNLIYLSLIVFWLSELF